MFRKKDNDYTEDYIASVEEYRDECTDEHGMTYENYNSEQSEHDAYSDSYSRFNSYTGDGERILWCGKTVSSAKLDEKGTEDLLDIIMAVFGVAFLLCSLPSFFSTNAQPTISVILIFVAVILISRAFKSRKREYAITNKRIIIYNCGDKSVAFESIDGLFNLEYYASKRNVGYVKYKKVFTRQYNANKVRSEGIYAIENPAEVYRILAEASAANKKALSKT